MAKRSKRKQTKHDAEVTRQAKKLEREGWSVEADVSGYKTPDSIGQKSPRRPDIVAKKRGATRIVEVETNDSIEKDKKQHATFRRSASQKKRTSFKVINADK